MLSAKFWNLRWGLKRTSLCQVFRSKIDIVKLYDWSKAKAHSDLLRLASFHSFGQAANPQSRSPRGQEGSGLTGGATSPHGKRAWSTKHSPRPNQHPVTEIDCVTSLRSADFKKPKWKLKQETGQPSGFKANLSRTFPPIPPCEGLAACPKP